MNAVVAVNEVDYSVVLEVASHEAVIRQAYKDSVGIWTWSVGLTGATGHDVERYIDNPASLQHCLNIFVWALRNYAAQVNDAFQGRDLTTAQFAAAVSFHWNTGAIGRAEWVKLWNAGDHDGARAAIMNWVTPPELKGRREKERDLFFDGIWSNDGTMAEFTRLTSRHTPDWSSRRRIDVAVELRAAFATVPETIPDRAPEPYSTVIVPTLTAGDEPAGYPPGEYSPELEQLQRVLQDEYPEVGPADGLPGSRTFGALSAFRFDNGLPQTDSLVITDDDRLALFADLPRPPSTARVTVTARDLAKGGSRTIKTANQATVAVSAGGLFGVLGTISQTVSNAAQPVTEAVNAIQPAIDAIEPAISGFQRILGAVGDFWWILAIPIVAFALWQLWKNKQARVDDQRRGIHA